MQELKLPELGENIETAEISSVLVSEGDVIERDQPVIEVETEKASFEVPAEAGGKVVEVTVKSGDTVRVGQTILKIETEEEEAASSRGRPAAEEKQEEEKEEGKKEKEETERKGQEAGEKAGAREAEKKEKEKEKEPREEKADTEAGEERRDERAAAERPARRRRPATGGKPETPEIGPTAPAAPSVRALARELGVDILQVPGGGPAGRISADDVKRHARTIIERSAEAPAEPAGAAAVAELPDFSRWGGVERVSLGGVRRATARSMATSWSQVPHVTQADRADVTEVEALRRRFNERADAEGAHLTWTAILVKVSATALRRFPRFNASLDLADQSLILKKFVHVGVAVDTERGLLVPVIRDVDRKGFAEVARELEDLAQRARDKKITVEEMEGACFTVTNLGGLGTTLFSPIVHWPEVAILGAGRAERVLREDDGEVASRLMLPLSLSYDHRAVDGADAARFLRWIAEALEQPFLMMAGS